MKMLPIGIKILGCVTKRLGNKSYGVDLGFGGPAAHLIKRTKTQSLAPGDIIEVRVSSIKRGKVNLKDLAGRDTLDELPPAEVMCFPGTAKKKVGIGAITGEQMVLPPWLRLIEEASEKRVLTVNTPQTDRHGRSIVFSAAFIPAAEQIAQYIKQRECLAAGPIVKETRHSLLQARDPILVDGGSYFLRVGLIGLSTLEAGSRFRLVTPFDGARPSVAELANVMALNPLRATKVT